MTDYLIVGILGTAMLGSIALAQSKYRGRLSSQFLGLVTASSWIALVVYFVLVVTE